MFAFGRIGFFIPMGFVAALSACATGRVNLVNAGAVDVQVENTSKVRIQGITVLAHGEQTVIYGRIRRLGVYNNAFSGKQVTSKAVFSDRSMYEQVDTLLTRTPRARSFRTIYPDAKFKIIFPEQLPPGTTLVLSFGNRSRSDG
ncbi:MAG: hypothetical protein WAS73_01805 [Defluviicoccus sp.]